MKALPIRQLPPLERGGVEARVGLSLQDHVAAGLAIDMLDDPRLCEVWCETQDDITLLWAIDPSEEVEFVQVKGTLFDGVWTIARLCRRESKNPGTSVIERLIACDRAAEEPRFRIITARDVDSDLRCLTYGFEAPGRATTDLQRVAAEIQTKLPGVASPKTNDFGFVINRTLWTVVHGEDEVRLSNIVKLQRHLQASGYTLAFDQVEELYAGIVTVAADAARARWEANPIAKRLLRSAFVDTVRQAVERATSPKLARAKFVPKMKAADLPDMEVAAAQELRRRYHAERLNPKYLSTSEYELVESECFALLQRLRAQFDADRTTDPAQFYSHCLSEVATLVSALPHTGHVPAFFAQGYVFEVVNRCLHRFTRGVVA